MKNGIGLAIFGAIFALSMLFLAGFFIWVIYTVATDPCRHYVWVTRQEKAAETGELVPVEHRICLEYKK